MSELFTSILANITGFITFFAPGYIFICCYNYTSCLPRETEKEYLVLKCISLSYLLYVTVSYIGNLLHFETVIIQIITFLCAIILGLLFGRIRRTNIANKISVLIFGREMSNNFFVDLWEKATDSKCVVIVTCTMKDNIGIYEGQIYKVSSYNANPKILLSYYICYDNNMKTLCDYSNDENSHLLINYSDIQRFEYELIPGGKIHECFDKF